MYIVKEALLLTTSCDVNASSLLQIVLIGLVLQNALGEQI